MSTPPEIGKSVGVRVDEWMRDDLEVLLNTGISVSDAIRASLALAAGIFRGAQEDGAPKDAVVQLVTYTWQLASNSTPTSDDAAPADGGVAA
ncbi:hypothetical protein SRB5_39110 [Streptomyces sp. RB5]|uniref:Uncharacterized protein n=1 Tax=Streptomyces smaragdinus TaxID=2585196 RepID=A0A7K0CJU5_9ACTN|nr:hypothetical protein [Streptomyces smaragdinus]MQY13759.1 hypothetical protein [Streptomyces smaragdinus]